MHAIFTNRAFLSSIRRAAVPSVNSRCLERQSPTYGVQGATPGTSAASLTATFFQLACVRAYSSRGAFRRSFSLHTHKDHEGPADYPKPKDIHIPLDKVQFAFARSSGPGGQNVNKLNTKAELRFSVQDAGNSWLPKPVAARLVELYGNHVNKHGEIIIVSQEHRTQKNNKEDCVSKLQHMLAEAYVEPKDRKMWVGLADRTKAKRISEKRHRSEIKASRRANKHDYD